MNVIKSPPLYAKCRCCGRGAESCQYCENETKEDWEAICDCGLYDFGTHLITCEDREEYKYIIASTKEGFEERL